MPDDRLIHLCLGHSAKVNALNDFERLVWLMYKLASDDFGVMRFSPDTLRESAEWLSLKTDRVVLKALERVREVNLIQTFKHQGRIYCYQWDWQTWQKIAYPRSTKQPTPPPELLATCDANTRWLFHHHPDGGKLKHWRAPKDSDSIPGMIPGNIPGEVSVN